MNLLKLLALFETASSVKLFRAEHAPFIVFFLNKHFKQSNKTLWEHSELVAALRGIPLRKAELDALDKDQCAKW